MVLFFITQMVVNGFILYYTDGCQWFYSLLHRWLSMVLFFITQMVVNSLFFITQMVVNSLFFITQMVVNGFILYYTDGCQ